MQFFRAIHLKKKYVILGVSVLAAIGLGAHFLPPVAEYTSAVLTAQTKRELPIYCVQTDEKKVAISFDAAWGADDTDELLQILDDNDVTATFFLCGYWVDKYPEEVEKIAAAGHDLGNHSATHPHMSTLSSEQITQELQGCHEAVKELTGIDMNLFRPPFGEYNDNVIRTAKENGYYSIQWDVDTYETKRKEEKRLLFLLLFEPNIHAILTQNHPVNHTFCNIPPVFERHVFPICCCKRNDFNGVECCQCF